MARKGKAKCSAGTLSGNWVIAVAGITFLIIGLTITLREGWSSPSRSGGRTSGSNPGLAPYGPHRPPFSDRGLLMPYPSYEYSMDVAHNVTDGFQSQMIGVYRHFNTPNVLSFLPHQAQRHPLRDVAPLTPELSVQFSRQHHSTGIYTPTRQRFYVKNRLGDPLYSVRPDYTVPSFGGGEFRKVGIVYNPNHPDLKLPLFGRPKIPGGNRFDYYVLDDTPHLRSNELPLDDHNGLELTTDDVVRVGGYGGDFSVYIYS